MVNKGGSAADLGGYKTTYMTEGGGCTLAMHGRSRPTIDPRTPAIPERSTSGFHDPEIACFKREVP